MTLSQFVVVAAAAAAAAEEEVEEEETTIVCAHSTAQWIHQTLSTVAVIAVWSGLSAPVRPFCFSSLLDHFDAAVAAA